MKRAKIATLLAAAVFSAFCADAAETAKLVKTRLAKTADVQLGVWHAGLSKCKAYAEKNGVPLIAVWSNGDACGHCVMFENACNNSYFKNWMKSSGCVFMFVYSKDSDGKQGGSVYNWCYKSQNLFPFIRVYWYKNGKKQVDTYTMGDTVDGGFSGEKGAKKAVAWFKSKLKNYKYTPTPATPKYTGGSLAVGDTEGDRLEAEVGVTKSVDMPISRTNAVANVASTNTVVVTYPNNAAEPVVSTIYWDAGETETNVTVNIPASLTTAGEKIEIVLRDAAGKDVATNHITMVGATENSPSNPLWIGEKSEDELEWGEWTMDLQVATNKVVAYNSGRGTATSGKGPTRLGAPASDKDRAYTLLLLEGALWCPDCHNTDKNLFLQEKFKTWAKENKVALVALDLALGDAKSTAPTLLTSDSAKSYITGSAASGAGYLSRKMIGKAEAADVLARNFEIAQKLRLPGWQNPTRPPVPSLFVLRDDGTVAGRIQYFGGVKSPTDDSNIDAHIKRLDELLLQVDEPEEESNDDSVRTMESIGPRTNVVDKTVSFVDTADVYRLNPETTLGKRIAFTLEGQGETTLLLTVTADSKVIAADFGTNGVSVAADVVSSNCYVAVSSIVDNIPLDDRFSVSNKVSSLCTYTLSTDFVVQPTEVEADNHIVIEDGVNEVTVALVSNQTYRITNLDTSNADNLAALAPGDREDFYVAQTTDDVRLALTAAETFIQEWSPGSVGFSSPSAFASESAGTYLVRLARSGGVSGTASATVTFTNRLDSTKLPVASLIGEPVEGFSQTFTWDEGDDSVKTLAVKILDNDFADGDQVIGFCAALGGDANPGIDSFKLTLRDNDNRKPGRLEISSADPSLSGGMKVFARAGSTLNLELGRVDGADGALAATLSASAGTLDETRFSWNGRDAASQFAQLTLPDTPGKKVNVELVPDKGTPVNSAKRKLTASLLAADVPGFAESSAEISAYRYLPIAERRIALDGFANDQTKVKKISGTLASGLAWKMDGGELVISGVPTAVGVKTAVFRAYNGSQAGLTVAVTVDVVDPVLAGGGDDGSAPLNAAVKTARTFADIPLFAPSTNRLAGVMTLTIPRTGRVSAKYRACGAGAVSFSCKNWTALGSDGSLAVSMQGAGGYALEVQALTNGAVAVSLADPAFPGEELKQTIPGVVWSRSNPATDFKGYYTVSLPRLSTISGDVLAAGDGHMTLKMNTSAAVNAGKVAYAGVLPTGKAFSGSAVLTPCDPDPAEGFWTRAILPVVMQSSADTLSGALQLTPGAADPTALDLKDTGDCAGRCYYQLVRRSVRPASECDGLLWSHVDTATTACEVLLDAAGTYYVGTDDFGLCCQSALSTLKLTFFACVGINDLDARYFDDEGSADGFDLGAGRMTSSEPVAVAGVNVKHTAKTKKAAAKNAITSAAAKTLSLSFVQSTGIVTGSFKLPFEDGTKTMTFSGVVMPGWGSGEDGCDQCSALFIDTSRPFISGTAWFNDELEDGNGKTVKVRRSCPFSIGVKAGY